MICCLLKSLEIPDSARMQNSIYNILVSFPLERCRILKGCVRRDSSSFTAFSCAGRFQIPVYSGLECLLYSTETALSSPAVRKFFLFLDDWTAAQNIRSPLRRYRILRRNEKTTEDFGMSLSMICRLIIILIPAF